MDLGPDMGDGEVVFTYSPIPHEQVRRIVPLGNLNPPGHTLPTDHMYFYTAYPDDLPHPDPATKHTVVAPAAGYVLYVLQPENDYKIMIKCTNSFFYYLDHLLLAPGIVAGITVQAGQVLGTSSGPYAIDFGAFDLRKTLPGFVNIDRYHLQTRHAVSPLAYYGHFLRGHLDMRVIRMGEDKHGKIDFDRDGFLVGNWFLAGVPVDQTDTPENWTKHLSFCRDVADPSIVRVSIGGQWAQSMNRAWAANPLDPDPATVTPPSGKKVYRLYNRGGLLKTPSFGFHEGLLVVQMLDDRTIKVEVFEDTVNTDRDFTANGFKIYTR